MWREARSTRRHPIYHFRVEETNIERFNFPVCCVGRTVLSRNGMIPKLYIYNSARSALAVLIQWLQAL